jgi:CheY-like chemotaxis protein
MVAVPGHAGRWSPHAVDHRFARGTSLAQSLRARRASLVIWTTVSFATARCGWLMALRWFCERLRRFVVSRILVVDDHRNTRESLALGFSLQGWKADCASAAAEALAMTRASRYELVVCDVRMPGSSGLELAVQLRAESPETTVILMTAYELGQLENELLRGLGLKLLIKPVTTDALMEASGLHDGVRQQGGIDSHKRSAAAPEEEI